MSLCFPFCCCRLPFRATVDFLLQNTLKVWRLIREWEGLDDIVSPLTLLYLNPDFPPGLERDHFGVWCGRGIRTLGDMVVNGLVSSFDQLKSRYEIPATQF